MYITAIDCTSYFYFPDGTTYPVGCDILIPFYFMGHNSSIFEAPEEFRPERFDVCRSEKFHTFAYVPFSAGPRNCIGQKFAMLEIKSIVSRILRQYRIELASDCTKYPILAAEIILRPKNLIRFHMSLRWILCANSFRIKIAVNKFIELEKYLNKYRKRIRFQ